MADFVRGNPHDAWPEIIAEGILLHRRIDVLTDSLPEVRQARHCFRAETYRVAPITLDVIWDHFLVRHWHQFESDISLPRFLAWAESEVSPHLPHTPLAFQHLNQFLWSERLLERYADAHYLEHVFCGMAAQRPRLKALVDSYQDFVRHYSLFCELFFQFYPRMVAQATAQQL